jgi:hypothetical protein
VLKEISEQVMVKIFLLVKTFCDGWNNSKQLTTYIIRETSDCHPCPQE